MAALRRDSRELALSAGSAMVARWMRTLRAWGTASAAMSSSRRAESSRIIAKRDWAHSDLDQA